jgi:hypothetical protein
MKFSKTLLTTTSAIFILICAIAFSADVRLRGEQNRENAHADLASLNSVALALQNFRARTNDGASDPLAIFLRGRNTQFDSMMSILGSTMLVAKQSNDDDAEGKARRGPEDSYASYPVPPATIPVTSVPALASSAQVSGSPGGVNQPGAIVTGPAWTALGPHPLPNGQTIPANANGISLTQAPVSGRLTAVVIDPTDPNIAYIGAAQGGLYRTLDGGVTWTQLLDNALSLAVGSLALDPTDSTHNTLLVGTGEANFSGDSYAGVGVYLLTNVKGSNPTLTGPFNSDGSTPPGDVMTHRSIPGLAIDPNDHNTVYVGTATGQQGIGPQPPTPGSAPARGLYRSTNFFSSSPTFTKIPMLGLLEPTPPDYRVTSIVYEPGSSDHMFVGVADASGNNDPLYYGGIYFTTNASAANPTFVRVFETNAGDITTASPFSPIKLAINKIKNTVTVVAVTGEPAPTDQGRAYKSTYNANAPVPPTFTELTAAQGFAGGQGFYNLAVDIDQADANNIYIAGTISSDQTNPAGTFKFSHDGGMTFTGSTNSLHVDSHMVGVAPSNGSIIYTGNDGGVWKSIDGAQNWTDLNNSTFSATQFQSVAVHPIDRNFTIGGTQDNGTEFYRPDGTWIRADFGDGGYALIDQSSPSVDETTMYHTYFNAKTSLIGFSRVKSAHCASEGNWAFRGIAVGVLPDTPLLNLSGTVCDGSPAQSANGMSIADDVDFYAPMALGPGTPNTVYFGTDKLYRSSDQGDTMTAVSQVLRPAGAITANSPISSIGISPQNDNVRICGTMDGHVFATTLGAPVLVDVTDATMPLKYVARAVIDPNNSNTAYVVFNGNAIAGMHVWKGDLSGFPTVTWTAIDGTGSDVIPDISVNAFVIDPSDSKRLYAGTDRGVYRSIDGGTTWSLFGSGLPDVQVFDLAIQNRFGILRAATHGRGVYEIPITGPQLRNISSRADVETGDHVLIGGFIVTGTTPKQVIIRAIGPSLNVNGVPVSGALQDPTLELHSGNATIAFNDNWRDSQEAEIMQSGLAPTSDMESAIIRTLDPGPYTAIVRGKNDTTGIGLVEIFDLDDAVHPRLANISSRAFVQTGDNVLIGGFIVRGGDATTAPVVVRAIGPSLATQGVSDALQDPTLELHDANGAVIAFDDNWKDSQQSDIMQTGLAPTNDAESAIFLNAAPGAYTAIVRGKNDTTGTALVEIYNTGE